MSDDECSYHFYSFSFPVRNSVWLHVSFQFRVFFDPYEEGGGPPDQLPVWAGLAVHDIPPVKVECLESFSTKEYAGAKKTCAQDPKIVVPILRKEPT